MACSHRHVIALIGDRSLRVACSRQSEFAAFNFGCERVPARTVLLWTAVHVTHLLQELDPHDMTQGAREGEGGHGLMVDAARLRLVPVGCPRESQVCGL